MRNNKLKKEVIECLQQAGYQGDPEELYKKLDNIFNKTFSIPSPSAISSSVLAQEFQSIFPSVKLPSGKNFRSNFKDIQKKLEYFRKVYDGYTNDQILQAATEYVRHAESTRFQYIRTAAYFIYKQGEGSDLADWCEKIKNDGTSEFKTTSSQRLV